MCKKKNRVDDYWDFWTFSNRRMQRVPTVYSEIHEENILNSVFLRDNQSINF